MANLVLTVSKTGNDSVIHIGNDVIVTVVKGKARVAIEAPNHITIDRGSVRQSKEAERLEKEPMLPGFGEEDEKAA